MSDTGVPQSAATATSPAPPPPDGTGSWLSIEQIHAIGRGTLHERMGIEFQEISRDRAVARMPVAGNTQPYGFLHGGASVVLAEGVGSILAVLHAGPGRAAVGVDINATHHRPVTSGWVTAVARPISVGRTTACLEIVITDDQGRRSCTCRFTAQLRDTPPAERSG